MRNSDFYILNTNDTGDSGNCPPGNQYSIYNYYCTNPDIQITLGAGRTCRSITTTLTPQVCDYVEAFIDTIITAPPYPPVFYRCYWNSPTPIGYETVEFEWSATSEYIEWYTKNISGQPNDVPNLILTAGGSPPSTSGFLVPLLKVTNHSPSLF